MRLYRLGSDIELVTPLLLVPSSVKSLFPGMKWYEGGIGNSNIVSIVNIPGEIPGFLDALSLRGLVAGLLLLRELGEQVKLSERSSAMLTGSRETFGE